MSALAGSVPKDAEQCSHINVKKAFLEKASEIRKASKLELADDAAILNKSQWIASPVTQNFYEIDVGFMTAFCVAVRSQGHAFALSGRWTFSDILLTEEAEVQLHDNGQPLLGALGISDVSSVEKETGSKAQDLDYCHLNVMGN